MSNKDLLDKCFDIIESKTRWLYVNDLIKSWFNLISWTALTAIVFVMAKQSGSYFLGGVGLVSFILVFFYGWHTLHENIKNNLKVVEGASKAKLLLFFLFAVIAPAGLLFYMFHAITVLVGKNA